jgi:hypothetical protein
LVRRPLLWLVLAGGAVAMAIVMVLFVAVAADQDARAAPGPVTDIACVSCGDGPLLAGALTTGLTQALLTFGWMNTAGNAPLWPARGRGRCCVPSAWCSPSMPAVLCGIRRRRSMRSSLRTTDRVGGRCGEAG